MDFVADERTLSDLDWYALVALVEQYRHAPIDLRTPIVPLFNETRATQLRHETAEALSLMRLDAAPNLRPFANVVASLARVEKGATLDGSILDGIRDLLVLAQEVRQSLDGSRERAPTLCKHAFNPDLDHLARLISDALEPGGRPKDGASVVLAKRRAEIRNLRERIRAKLESFVLKQRDVLSDDIVTQRDGRYVVLMRTDAHRRLQGIVHGTSASGASLYLEPTSVVEQGNRLQVATAEAAVEEERIFAALSEEVGLQTASIAAASDELERVDARFASARAGIHWNGHVLTPSENVSELELRAFRHPLLLSDGVDVVPLHLNVTQGGTTVISGPNAGGKTIALKAVGLTALMTRAGLPVPCHPDTVLPNISRVVSDIGDEQSVKKNLSTFSAHLNRLQTLLDQASERTLILVDEIAAATAPDEGEALAAAWLEDAQDQGATTVVTTHFSGLKAWAAQRPAAANASVDFDAATLRPRFTVTHGVPGNSHAFDVAQRWGLPARIIERARTLLGSRESALTALLDELRGKRDSAERAVKESEALAKKARHVRDEADARLEKMKAQGARAIDDASREMLGEKRALRKALKAARSALRQSADADAFAATEAALAAADAATPPLIRKPILHGGVPTDRIEFTVGDRVKIGRLNTTGKITELDDQGRARVTSGSISLWADVIDLERASSATKKQQVRAQPLSNSSTADTVMSRDNMVDLRGLRADDAEAMLGAFIDRQFASSRSRIVFVRHGIGSGALARVTRLWLDAHPHYVKSHRRSDDSDGGPATTRCELKDS